MLSFIYTRDISVNQRKTSSFAIPNHRLKATQHGVKCVCRKYTAKPTVRVSLGHYNALRGVYIQPLFERKLSKRGDTTDIHYDIIFNLF